ncbi:MAG: protein-glutamate O-methyltransferase CheR, partial [Bacteroidetes bacterium]|nr:protein-glutamate O-methyltransferase CheR [Bacteroidota bacterium]
MGETPEIKDLLESIRFVYGYDFTEYAQASIQRRVSHFMGLYKIPTIKDLGKRLLQDENLFEQFVQEVTVNVTEMFRDPNFYKSLRSLVLPRLATYPFIRIWIAGASTGEEVYSMAILLKEEGLLERSVIYATDINQRSLQIAREGIYRADHMKLYTANYQKAGGQRSFSD